MTLTAFLTIWAIHLMAAISPGPSFVVSVRTAVTDGFANAAALAVGFGIGAMLWAIAALAGMALLFELMPQLLRVLILLGAVFLVWVAWSIWRHAATPLPHPTDGRAPSSRWGAFRLGFLTFATNPKASIFFGAIFVGLVPPGTSMPWLIAIVAAVFLNETLWYIFVARVFSRGRARAVYGRIKPTADRVLAGLILLLALKMALG